MDLRHAYRFLRQDLPGLTLLKARNRRVHAHIVTLHQSGSHWLNYMLASCLQEQYGLPDLHHIRDRRIIGRPQDPITHGGIPRIVQSHAIPSPLVHAGPLPSVLTFPRYVLLIRDLRACLVSYYEKSKELKPFQVSFSDFLRNERVLGNGIRRDLWNRIRFLNAWSRDRERLPAERFRVLRYEELKSDPASHLQGLWEFLEMPPQGTPFFQRGVDAASKDRMSRGEHPGENLRIVRKSDRHPFEWFNEADRRYFTDAVTSHLRDWFGYRYDDWSLPCTAREEAA